MDDYKRLVKSVANNLKTIKIYNASWKDIDCNNNYPYVIHYVIGYIKGTKMPVLKI